MYIHLSCVRMLRFCDMILKAILVAFLTKGAFAIGKSNETHKDVSLIVMRYIIDAAVLVLAEIPILFDFRHNKSSSIQVSLGKYLSCITIWNFKAFLDRGHEFAILRSFV